MLREGSERESAEGRGGKRGSVGGELNGTEGWSVHLSPLSAPRFKTAKTVENQEETAISLLISYRIHRNWVARRDGQHWN